METYLTELLKPFLLHPECISLEKIVDERGVLFKVFIHKDDMGFVIGSRGMTINAIRHILRVLGQKNSMSISILLKQHEDRPLTTKEGVTAYAS